MGYAGNKRNEIPFIYDYLNFDNITTIIEPYAGTCSISYYISTKKTGLKYILNDNNKYLLEMFYLLKDDNKIKQFEEEFKEKCEYFKNDKNKYMEIIKEKTLMGWFIKNKVYCIRPGLFPINNNRTYKETLDLKSFSIYDFFNNNDITFLNIDGLKFKNCAVLYCSWNDNNNMYLEMIYEGEIEKIEGEYWTKEKLTDPFDAFFKTEIGRISQAIGFGLKDSITHVVQLQSFLISAKNPAEIFSETESNFPFRKKYAEIKIKYEERLDFGFQADCTESYHVDV
jgi:hypothetical protein